MRTCFIGDVHGCIDELAALIGELSLAADDEVVFLADFLDRGPDPVAVVRYVRQLARRRRTLACKGNHEEKALRWLVHEDKVAAGKQAKNPMRPVRPSRQAEWKGLDAEDRAFLDALPLVLEFDIGGAKWVAVHGGLLPGRPLADQVRKHADEIIRCRWVNAEGKHVPMQHGSKEQPPGSFTWMERFDGPFNVVCGHAVHDKVTFQPRVDKSASGHEIWSIDTGCYGGGRLTALILDSESPGHRQVVQVQAAREYYPFNDDAT